MSVRPACALDAHPVLRRFIEGIDEDFLWPVADRAPAVRRRLQAALATAPFRTDCARALLAQAASMPTPVDFFRDDAGRYVLRVFCWPPAFGNAPHLHRSWTVAGILKGALLVRRSAQSAAQCLAAEPIAAVAGQAGMLVPPQFHCLRNDGDTVAISLHVFSRDAPEEAGPDERAPRAAAFDDDELVAITALALDSAGAQALDCVDAAFPLVGLAAKLELMKLTLACDLDEGIRLGRSLCRLVGEADGRRLSTLLDRVDRSPLQAARGLGPASMGADECRNRLSSVR